MKTSQISFGGLVYSHAKFAPVSKEQKNLLNNALIKNPLIKEQIDALDRVNLDISVCHNNLNTAGSENELIYSISKKLDKRMLCPIIPDAPRGIKEVANEATAEEFLREAAARGCKYMASNFRKLANLTKT